MAKPKLELDAVAEPSVRGCSGISSIDGSSLGRDLFVAGDLIGEKYIVDRVLGVGGVGIVIAAQHVELEETVAIKFLRPEMQRREEVVRRFANEAKAAVRIKSEHAARVYDVGVLPRYGPYLVMEYLEGQNLADMLEVGIHLPTKRIVELTLQACEALAVAHSNGIVHRDIKPDNLFLARRFDGAEVMKLLDFGISKALLTGSSVDTVGSRDVLGTPLYMSPEQIRGTVEIDHRSDIWSLGVVLYELFARQVPFPGDTVTMIFSRVLETKPPPLASFVSLPVGLEDVILRCLEKDREQRFQNMAELAIALLPFAPSRGTASAERTSGILQAAGHVTSLPVRLGSAPPPSTGRTAPMIPSAPRVPVFSSVPGEPVTLTEPSMRPAAARPPRIAPKVSRPPRRTTALLLAAGIIGPLVAFMIGRTLAATPEAKIAISVEPPNARLYLDGVPLGSSPYRAGVDRDGQPHVVRAEAPGYSPRSVTVVLDADKDVFLALDKAR